MEPLSLDLSHIGSPPFQDVYEPSEDTFLLADAAQLVLQKLHQEKQQLNETPNQFHINVFVEVGCGSGMALTTAAIVQSKLENNQPIFAIACDISHSACKASQETIKRNLKNELVSLTPLRTNFLTLSACFPWLNYNASSSTSPLNGIDLLLFNPPYVPSPPSDRHLPMNAIWAGGENGREVIDQFIPLIPKLLKPKGWCLLLVCKENNPEEIIKVLERYSLKSTVFFFFFPLFFFFFFFFFNFNFKTFLKKKKKKKKKKKDY